MKPLTSNPRASNPRTGNPKSKQSGITLIESLVSLVILALGVMGLAGVQTRLLVESRTANSRAVAVGLIDDLTNRILLNRPAAFPVAPAVSAYVLTGFLDNVTSPTVAQDCVIAACTAAQMATSDLNQWRLAVERAFPGGQAFIFRPAANPNQLGIAIAWRSNERTLTNNDGTAVTAAIQAQYTAPFAVTANTVPCPAAFICHVVFVQP